MRVFLRDKNPDLMDQYLNQGLYRSIPVFAFFDENMKEVARFIERPPAQTEEIDKKMLDTRRALRAERYRDWRAGVVQEIRSLLKV
jgi:Thioredoxin